MTIFVKMIYNCNCYLCKNDYVLLEWILLHYYVIIFGIGPCYIFIFWRKPYHLHADFSNLNFHSNAHRSLQTFLVNVVRPFNLLNFSLPYTKSKKLISITLTLKNLQSRPMKKVCRATFVVCKCISFWYEKHFSGSCSQNSFS